MANKILLSDDFLDKISGGTIKEGTYEALDATIAMVREMGLTKEDLIWGIQSMWTDSPDSWKEVSTDGSQKDLEDLLAYIEKNF